MNTTVFKQRIRQLMAADKNAVAIYSDLAKQFPEIKFRPIFMRIAREEARHVKIAQAILKLLEN